MIEKIVEGDCRVCNKNTQFRIIYVDLDMEEYSLYKCLECGKQISRRYDLTPILSQEASQQFNSLQTQV